jgi:hypothetical protein
MPSRLAGRHRRVLRYHRGVIPHRERLLQLARLVGIEAFSERFGPPQTADPAPDALRTLIEERLDAIAHALIEEAAASDDVTDVTSAQAYLEDRLATLGDLLSDEQAERLREAFRVATKGW